MRNSCRNWRERIIEALPGDAFPAERRISLSGDAFSAERRILLSGDCCPELRE
jgi:hypothetical protein